MVSTTLSEFRHRDAPHESRCPDQRADLEVRFKAVFASDGRLFGTIRGVLPVDEFVYLARHVKVEPHAGAAV